MSLSVNTQNTIFTSPLFMYTRYTGRPLASLFCSKRISLKRHPHASNIFFHKGSYTVEAAVIMPIFLYVCVSVLIFFGVIQKEWDTRIMLSDAARNAAVYGSVLPEDFSVNAGLVNINEKDIEITATYPVIMPFDYFGLHGMVVTENIKTHRWVGYDPNEGMEENEDVVYVTESGSAYHKSIDCTYLNPSISAVSKDKISDMRNSGGAKYYACPLCKGKGSTYYITNYGNRYHTSLACSGLKRTIRSESLQKAQEEGYHACTKCAKGE